MASKGKATLGDALSPEMRVRMARLREDLQRAAQETIKAQLAQPKAPWQVNPTPPKVKLSTGSAREVTKVAVSSGSKSGGLPFPLFGERRTQPRPPSGAKSRNAKIEKEQPFRFWDLPLEAAVREPAPTTIA